MKNSCFEVTFNPDNGGLDSLRITGDKYRLNWVEGDSTFGVPFLKLQVAFNRFEYLNITEKTVLDDMAVLKYENSCVSVDVVRSNKEVYSEEYIFKNNCENELFFPMGTIGIDTPFNDNYDKAEYCLTNRCNAHIRCGENSTYIGAFRMGNSKENVGMILTEGSVSSYTQTTPEYAKNDRGDFRLDFTPFSLLPGEEYKCRLEFFTFESREDFFKQASRYESFIDVRLNHQTLFIGEKLLLSAYAHSDIKQYKISFDNREYSAEIIQNKLVCGIEFDSPGEKKIEIEINGVKTHASVFVTEDIDKLTEARVKFICEKQQYHNEKSCLHGAYLIYDNDTNSLYFNNFVSDHNASRERLGMGILVAKYLQKHNNGKYLKSLLLYCDFVFREFVNRETGDVFDTIGMDKRQIRLYNAPWVCIFCMEMYKLTGEKDYLITMLRVMEKYYENGGERFYPNGICISEPIEVLKSAGMKSEAERLLRYAIGHTDNILSYGVNYPKHEVDYEQTIVCPAVTFLLEAYKLTADKKYLDGVSEHLINLRRFESSVPDYHLYAIPIRHWDDYWFGKQQCFGDTFPHYWSCLDGWAYNLYYKLTKQKEYAELAEDNLRNCLCLFNPDGSSSCAYIYPYMLGDKRGEFFDSYANDQDFALYFANKFFERN